MLSSGESEPGMPSGEAGVCSQADNCNVLNNCLFPGGVASTEGEVGKGMVVMLFQSFTCSGAHSKSDGQEHSKESKCHCQDCKLSWPESCQMTDATFWPRDPGRLVSAWERRDGPTTCKGGAAHSVKDMPSSRPSRDFTESLDSMTLTLEKRPTSRRKSRKVMPPSQSCAAAIRIL